MEECSYNNFSLYTDDNYFEPSLNCLNTSSNQNATQESPEDELVVTIVVGIVLGIIILVTVVGEYSNA